MLGNRRLPEDVWTVMMIVVDSTNGDIPAVKKGARRLRSSGKDMEEAVAALNDRQYGGRGPLHMAAWAGRLEMCKFLIKDLRLIVDAPGDGVKCAELLIKAGADVNAGRPVTPLVIAAAHGFTDCVKCLLDAGADANIPDHFGRTPAEVAAARGWMDCAEILSPLTSAGIDDGAFESLVLKMQGDAAFEENAYADASALYTMAMEADRDDSTLYAKRSLCWVHLSEEDKALDDANTYKAMEMDLSNSWYEQAAALILTKEYAQACQALMSGLKLDLRSDDLD